MLTAFFLTTYGGFMLTVDEILEEGESVGGGTPYSKGCYVLSYSGGLYPFDSKGLLNPLDPVNLILCWPLCDDEELSDEDEDFESVLDTMLAVTDFRKKGFSVMTRYKSGAARTIKLNDGTDKVIILGDYAKEKKLLLPILSTQLSDMYVQSNVELWKSLGFRTPPHYGISRTDCDYDLHEWQGDSVLSGTDHVTYYNIIGGGRKVTVRKVHREAEVQTVSDDDDRDWDYGYTEFTTYKVSVTPFSESLEHAPFKKTTPNYVWEDKNAEE